LPALPAATERVLHAIDGLGASRGLVLGGGTALALRLGHRRSADLDFVFDAPRLPKRRIATLVGALREHHRVSAIPDVAAEQDFLDSGLELADYQQDYSVDGVKITFFVPDPPGLRKEIRSEEGQLGLKRVGVATLDSLFVMKCAVLNVRMTARDLFDVYTLIERHGYSAAEVFSTAQRLDYSPDVLKERLIHAKPRRDDPGIEAVAGPGPTFEQLQGYFVATIDRLEQDEAAAMLAPSSTQRSPPKKRSRRPHSR
jgi:hypothetical protein